MPDRCHIPHRGSRFWPSRVAVCVGIGVPAPEEVSIGLAASRSDRLWQQSTEPQQIVGGADQIGIELRARDSAEAGLAQAPDCLHPAKDLFHALAMALAERITGMTGGAPIQARRSAMGHLGNVGLDAPRAQVPDEVPGMIALIRGQRPRSHALVALAAE